MPQKYAMKQIYTKGKSTKNSIKDKEKAKM